MLMKTDGTGRADGSRGILAQREPGRRAAPSLCCFGLLLSSALLWSTAAAALEPDQLSSESVAEMMAAVGIREGRLPERMARINSLLDAMSIPARERLLTEFFNDLFIYKDKC